jgi:hypothetical protein
MSSFRSILSLHWIYLLMRAGSWERSKQEHFPAKGCEASRAEFSFLFTVITYLSSYVYSSLAQDRHAHRNWRAVRGCDPGTQVP